MGINTIEELVEDLRAGRMVVVMDDESRENEGDLVLPAAVATAEDVNFMASFGRGLICLTLTKERCQQLRLPLMVSDNRSAHSTKLPERNGIPRKSLGSICDKRISINGTL